MGLGVSVCGRSAHSNLILRTFYSFEEFPKIKAKEFIAWCFIRPSIGYRSKRHPLLDAVLCFLPRPPTSFTFSVFEGPGEFRPEIVLEAKG